MGSGKKDNYGLRKDISSIFEGVSVGQPSCRRRPMLGDPSPAERPKQANPAVGRGGKAAAKRHGVPAPVSKARAKQMQADQASDRPKVVEISQGGALATIKNRLLAPKPGVSAARHKTMLALVPVLTIALICAITQVFGTSPRTSKAQDTEDNVADKETANEFEWELPEPYPANLRDPMMPVRAEEPEAATKVKPVAEKAVERQHDIGGILYSEDNPSAMIGTSIVREGDMVDGVKVVKINENSIVFEVNGEVWTEKVRR